MAAWLPTSCNDFLNAALEVNTKQRGKELCFWRLKKKINVYSSAPFIHGFPLYIKWKTPEIKNSQAWNYIQLWKKQNATAQDMNHAFVQRIIAFYATCLRVTQQPSG